MLTLDRIKLYLRVDGDEEIAFLEQLKLFSREEIENSTGVKYNKDNLTETYKLAQLIIIADRYENRGSEDQEFRPNNILSCLYTKLKYIAAEEPVVI